MEENCLRQCHLQLSVCSSLTRTGVTRPGVTRCDITESVFTGFDDSVAARNPSSLGLFWMTRGVAMMTALTAWRAKQQQQQQQQHQQR